MTSGSTTWTYTYDANGMRTSRSNGNLGYTYVYNGGSLSKMTYTGLNSATLYFSYDASGRPLSVSYTDANETTTTYYYITNLQGDVLAIVDSTGTAVVQYTYDAWGRQLSMTGTMKWTLGMQNPLRYRGYVYDSEIGYYYLQSRYYNPTMGRFLNADVYISTGQGVLDNNMFAYCGNNPINYVDYEGTAERPVGAGIQIELSVGSAVAGVEIIVYWDDTVCNGGNPILAVYVYGGISPEMGDIVQSAVIALSCDDALLTGSTQLITLSLSMLSATISRSYSVAASAVLIMGNDSFCSIKNYAGAFVSAGGNFKFLKWSYARSDTCYAVSLGGTFPSNPCSFGISKTYYFLQYSTTLGNIQGSMLYNNGSTIGYGRHRGGGGSWLMFCMAWY